MYAQKKISRSDELQYQAAEQPRRPERPLRETMLDEELPRMSRQPEEVLQLMLVAASRQSARRTSHSMSQRDKDHEVPLLQVHRRGPRRARPRGAALAALGPAPGSGFDNPYGMPYEDEGHSLQALHDAILEALLNGGLLSDEMLEKLLGKDWQDADDAGERLES
jgi:hypothetical protein